MARRAARYENPLVCEDRRRGRSSSAWQRSFSCEELRPLIICRGPIRKEALDVFEEMGITHCGILLSEKDSIIYDTAMAPELRKLRDDRLVHRVRDYGGADGEERRARIGEIVRIAADCDYNAVFAGYGFMAEDHEMIAAVEEAGLRFIGPCSRVALRAGFKDEAKRTALRAGVSVTPGVDNAAALTLLAKHPDEQALVALLKKNQLQQETDFLADPELSLEEKAERVLQLGQRHGLEWFSLEELGAQVGEQVLQLLAQYPDYRIRLKAVGGGGGKGQRILGAEILSGVSARAGKARVLEKAAEMVREILGEVKASGPRDNRNILIELNVEETRHQEIQVLGNGEWCISLGGRDCSAQMHEQKLLELSLTAETLEQEIESARAAGADAEARALHTQQQTLQRMEEEAVRFGREVGLDSVSTFECIVGREQHFFMEVNTRIQVEHRVSELCYALRFQNPEVPEDYFDVHSLVEMMALLALHGSRLPLPEKVLREGAAAEARLNASNDALAPHAGGVISDWSAPGAGEIRDDQGISLHTPATDSFMRYRITGAYDSNIALLLATGEGRRDCISKLAEILRNVRLEGEDLATNMDFHRGLLEWLLSWNPHAQLDTRFVQSYLAAIGQLYREVQQLDFEYAWELLGKAQADAEQDSERRRALAQTMEAKKLLLLRPLQCLLQSPHLLAGWAVRNRQAWAVQGKAIKWLKNPLQVIEDTYYFLNMDFHPGKPAAHCIWSDDQQLLQRGLDFYRELGTRLGSEDFLEQQRVLAGEAAPKGFSASLWRQVQAAHLGFQCGTGIVLALFRAVQNADFYSLQVRDDLRVAVPPALQDAALQEEMRRVLAPPPAIAGDVIPAPSGGMFYAREAPGMPPFVETGRRIEAGDALCIIEVMKMFNKLRAPFAGTVEKILVDSDGMTVAKGQPLFKIRPAVELEVPDANQAAELRCQIGRAHV